MHEFSIAEAIARQVERHAPPGRVASVEVRAGALRGLDAEALRMCWDAVTHDTPLRGSSLELDLLPWTLTCTACSATWPSPVPFVRCDRCGNPAPVPVAGDELDLVAITVDDDVPVGSSA